MVQQPNSCASPSPIAPTQVFIYGTLCAMPLLAWALTGDSSNVTMVKNMCRPARVRGYARRSLHGKDFPAIIKATDHENSDEVEGYVITFQNKSQRKKLDDFEGELYKAIRVSAEVETGPSQGIELVEVDMYLWDGDMDNVAAEAWSLETFIKERLDDWLDLFEGMELTGED